MTRLLKLHEDAYAAFFQWLQHTLPQLPTNRTDIWTPFLSASQLSEADARQALSYGSDPIVFVENLEGVDGYFDSTRPKTINLAAEVVGVAAPDPTKLERTVLHEMVHWGWARAGRTETREEGEQFEIAAYGGRDIAELARLANEDALGALSRRWEARDNPGAIGRDTNGGWSYGLYQLSSRQGRIADFIAFLDRTAKTVPKNADFSRTLREAGSDADARRGSPEFQSAWKSLAADPAFAEAQHEFIRTTHYEPFVSQLMSDGIDIRARSEALKDVAWSVSVQHGPGSTVIFTRAWQTLAPPARTDDASFISAIYQERRRVDVYFKSSTPREREAVLRRFQDEQVAALQMLQIA